MTTDAEGEYAQARAAMRPRSRLFTVRLWQEDVASGCELRGHVRNVANGAGRGFRDWSDLAAFLTGQMLDEESSNATVTEGGS